MQELDCGKRGDCMKKRLHWTWGLGLLLVILGIILHASLGDMLSTGQFAGNYFAAGDFSMGVFAAGTFAVGIFSIGIFSIGIFSIGIFSVGLVGAGLFVWARWKNKLK